MSDNTVESMLAECRAMRQEVRSLHAKREEFERQLTLCRSNLPQLVELARRVRGQTTRQLAAELGVTEGYLSSIRTGKIADKVGPELIEKIGAILGSQP